MKNRRIIGNNPLQISGAFIAVFSPVGGLLVLFVIPGACTFESGLELFALSFLFVVGILVFFLSEALSRLL